MVVVRVVELALCARSGKGESRKGRKRKKMEGEGSGISVCVIEGINNRLARPNPPTAFRQQTLIPFSIVAIWFAQRDETL